jgi:hypothetical protein
MSGVSAAGAPGNTLRNLAKRTDFGMNSPISPLTPPPQQKILPSRKCVIVFGPESSGSKLVAKIIAHVLDVQSFGDWNGAGWCVGEQHRVCHRSLPFGATPQFPDVAAMIQDHREGFDLRFILTTRDQTLSQASRVARFKKTPVQLDEESARAREIILGILKSGWPALVWSYETLMFLRDGYLAQLYDFLGVTSDFMPTLTDGNAARLKQALPIAGTLP